MIFLIYSFIVLVFTSWVVNSFGICVHNDDASTCRKKTLSFEAISDLHEQLDGDRNGGVDPKEAERFLEENLSTFVDRKSHKDFSLDDDYISLLDLWKSWQRNPAHNWTVEETRRWLTENVDLPQYNRAFLLHGVDGEVLPRLVTRNMTYLHDNLLIRNPLHRRKLVLKTTDLILFGPPKKPVASFKDLAVVSLFSFGILLTTFICLNYYYVLKLRGRDSAVHDGLYKAEQTLRELQQKLKEADPLSNYGRRRCDEYDDDGMLLQDSGCISDQTQSTISSIDSSKSTPCRPLLPTSKTTNSQPINCRNLFDPSWLSSALGISCKISERVCLPDIRPPTRPGKTLPQSASFTINSSKFSGDLSYNTNPHPSKSSGRQSFGPKRTNSLSSSYSFELYLWLKLTHEIEFRNYWEKRTAAAKQLFSAKEACERVRRKRGSLMGSIQLIHSDNLDDVDSKLNSARCDLENVGHALQERTVRWTRIEELTGMRLQETVDMPSLLSHLCFLQDSRSIYDSQRTPDMPVELPNCCDSTTEWTPSGYHSDNRRHRIPTAAQDGPAATKNFSCDVSGRSSPDSIEPTFQSRLPRNYSFVRPFATFWRRKAMSNFVS